MGTGADAGIPLLPIAAEFARPFWNFGQATYAFTGAAAAELIAAELIAACTRSGFWSLLTGVGDGLTPSTVDIPYDQIGAVKAIADGTLVLLAGSGREPASVVLLAPQGVQVLRRSAPVDLPEGTISLAQAIEFPSAAGRTAYGFYYPPKSSDHQAPPGTLPPLRRSANTGTPA